MSKGNIHKSSIYVQSKGYKTKPSTARIRLLVFSKLNPVKQKSAPFLCSSSVKSSLSPLKVNTLRLFHVTIVIEGSFYGHVMKRFVWNRRHLLIQHLTPLCIHAITQFAVCLRVWMVSARVLFTFHIVSTKPEGLESDRFFARLVDPSVSLRAGIRVLIPTLSPFCLSFTFQTDRAPVKGQRSTSAMFPQLERLS